MLTIIITSLLVRVALVLGVLAFVSANIRLALGSIALVFAIIVLWQLAPPGPTAPALLL